MAKVSAVVRLSGLQTRIPINEYCRKFIEADQSTAQWVFQTIRGNDNNWLLAIALTIDEIYSRTSSACRVDCGNGEGLVVLFGQHAEIPAEEEAITALPSVKVSAGIMTISNDEGLYGVVSAQESLHDHFSYLLATGLRNPECLVELQVETRASLLSRTIIPRYMVRILGVENSWEDSVAVEVIADTTTTANQSVSNDGDENSAVVDISEPPPTKRTRTNAKEVVVATRTSTRRAKAAATAAPPEPVKTPPPEAAVAKAPPQEPVVKAPPQTVPAKAPPQTVPAKAPPQTVPAKAPPRKTAKAPPQTSAAKTQPLNTKPAAPHVTAKPAMKPLPAKIQAKQSPAAKGKADDDESETKIRKEKACFYAPFCTKLAVECGGYQRGRCSQVNDGLLPPFTDEDLQEAKRERKKEQKRLEKRRSKLRPSGVEPNGKKNETATKKPLPSQEKAFNAKEIGLLEKAFNETTSGKQQSNGKTKAAATAKNVPSEKTSFNPREYVLLAKAFDETLSNKEAKDTGRSVQKKDIKAAVTIFKDIETERSTPPPVVHEPPTATTPPRPIHANHADGDQAVSPTPPTEKRRSPHTSSKKSKKKKKKRKRESRDS